MKKLTNEQVEHVANLARLAITEEEKEKYAVQLADILTEIDKINQVEVDPKGEILISPTTNENKYSKDEVGTMLSKEEIFQNANHEVDGYFVVPGVFHD